MKDKHFPAPFFNHFIQRSPRTIAKLKSLHGVFKFLHKNGPINLWLVPPTSHLTTSKCPPTQPICSSKSYKYNNYDKAKYKVSLCC